MNWRFLGCLLIVTLACYGVAKKGKGDSVAGGDVFIFSEAFGDPQREAILLNAGAGSQSIVGPMHFVRNWPIKGILLFAMTTEIRAFLLK